MDQDEVNPLDYGKIADVPTESVPAEAVPDENVTMESFQTEGASTEDIPLEDVVTEEIPTKDFPTGGVPLEFAPVIEGAPEAITPESGVKTDIMDQGPENAATASGAVDGNLRPRKEFKFAKPIEELYDEKASDTDDMLTQTQKPGKRKKQKKVKTKKKGCLLALLYTAIIVAVAGLIAAFLISSVIDISAVGKPDRKVDVPIPKNASTAVIANRLKSAGVIDNNLAFRIFVRFKHESGFKYGTYTLNSDMGYSEIIATLKKSATDREVVKVTIPEGKTLMQIDQILADKNICDAGEFITAEKEGGFQFKFDSLIPNNTDRFYRYEGYYFPDTYEFYVGSTGKAAAQKFLDNFDVKFDATLQARAATMDMTVDQVITLASIIQSETGDVKQMAKVSSVFHNRLANGLSAAGGKKLLQSDATIFYATNDIQPVLQQASTEIVSAYNTYKHEGLPPGPICNPGIDAIKAALYPDNTNYYYFVTDNNGDYFYADTYAKHAANVKKALRSNSAKGTDVFK